VKRRQFIAGLGSAAAWPVAARAQQNRMPIIGYLSNLAPGKSPEYLAAFRRGLSEVGFVEGRNVIVEYRWADGDYGRMPGFAAELVQRHVDVIVAPAATPSALAAKAATTTIPIVFMIGSDPVEMGLVASLNRPGGNITGATSLSAELGPKLVQVLHEALPAEQSLAALVNPSDSVAAAALSRDLQAAARTLGLDLHILHASSEGDFGRVFARVPRLPAGGVIICSDSFYNIRSSQIAAVALRNAIPAISPYRDFAIAGGLMTYGASVTDGFRSAGAVTGRILKGEKPGDLPVQQATKIELVINMKTAKALGLMVPQTLLVSADEVIE
jgi:putative ABC transport system substrate-binding protein